MNPEAYVDCLHLASELDAPMEGITRLELQRIAFLSCLLSIYDGKTVSDWGYKFANTGTGVSFSNDLDAAADFLLSAAALRNEHGRLRITDLGRSMLARLRTLQANASRVPCLDAAATSLIALPASVMLQGLEQEPSIVASHMRDGATMLLDEPHLHILYAHFGALAQVIPPSSSDLLSPSVLWLTYMAQESAGRFDRAEIEPQLGVGDLPPSQYSVAKLDKTRPAGGSHSPNAEDGV